MADEIRSLTRNGKLDPGEVQRQIDALRKKIKDHGDSLTKLGKEIQTFEAQGGEEQTFELLAPTLNEDGHARYIEDPAHPGYIIINPLWNDSVEADKLYWLHFNYIESKQDGEGTYPVVVIRATLGGGTTESDGTVIVYLGMIVERAASGGTQAQAYTVLTQKVLSSADITLGYADLRPADLAVGDTVRCILVAASNSMNYADTIYGNTDRDFIVGWGVEIPETPSLTLKHHGKNRDKYVVTMASHTKDGTEPYLGPNCNNYYAKLMVYSKQDDGVNDNPDTSDEWQLVHEIGLKNKVKKLTAGQTLKPVSFRVPHEPGEEVVVCVQITDVLNQEGGWSKAGAIPKTRPGTPTELKKLKSISTPTRKYYKLFLNTVETPGTSSEDDNNKAKRIFLEEVEVFMAPKGTNAFEPVRVGAGTVTITSGSRLVVGSGTKFLDEAGGAPEVAIGDALVFAASTPSAVSYDAFMDGTATLDPTFGVMDIIDDTHLTLDEAPNFSGTFNIYNGWPDTNPLWEEEPSKTIKNKACTKGSVRFPVFLDDDEVGAGISVMARVKDELMRRSPWGREIAGGGTVTAGVRCLFYLNGTGSANPPILVRFTEGPPNLWEDLDIESKWGFAAYPAIDQLFYDRVKGRVFLSVNASADRNQHIIYSDDFGDTWAEVPGEILMQQSVAQEGYGQSIDGQRIYLFTSPSLPSMLGYIDTAAPIINLSTPEGNNALFGGSIFHIAVHPTAPQILFGKGGESDYVYCDDADAAPSAITGKWDSGTSRFLVTSGSVSPSDVGKYVLGIEPSYTACQFVIVSVSGGGTILEIDGDTPSTAEHDYKVFSHWTAITKPALGGEAHPLGYIFLRNGTLLMWGDGMDLWALSGTSWACVCSDTKRVISFMWQDDFDDNVLYGSYATSSGHLAGFVKGVYADGAWTFAEMTGSDLAASMNGGNLQGHKLIKDSIYGLHTNAGYAPMVSFSKDGIAAAAEECSLAEDWSDYAETEAPGDPDQHYHFCIENKIVDIPPEPPQTQNPVYMLCRNLTSGATEKRRIYRSRDGLQTIDKIWGDGTDYDAAAPAKSFLEVEFLQGLNTRVYRAAEGNTSKFSTTEGLGSSQAVEEDFSWFAFMNPPTSRDVIKFALDNASPIAYACDKHDVWRVNNRLASAFEMQNSGSTPTGDNYWVKILAWASTEADRVFSCAIDKDTNELFAVCKDGDVKYCANPYYDGGAPTWDAGSASGFGSAEAVDILVTKTYVYVVGNNASFKVRRAPKADIIAGTATWATVAEPSGIGTLEIGGLFIDDDDEDIALIMTRTATKGLWGCSDLTTDDSPTWSSDLVLGAGMRCACKMDAHNYCVAGNGKIYKVSYTGAWSAAEPDGADDVSDLANKNFTAVASQRTYFPTGGGSA